MPYYVIHGLKVESDFVLEAAQQTAAFGVQEREIWIHSGELGALTVESAREQEQGRGFFVCYEKQRGCVRAVGNGCFLMQNGDEIIYQLKEPHDPLLCAEVILCMCMSVLMIQRDRLLLHGSGVLWEEKAVIISGPSGSGKSTFAETLLRNGGLFMADDTVAVDLEAGVPYAHPAFPQQKLTVDAAKAYGFDVNSLIRLPAEAKEKYAIRLKDGYCTEKKVLGAIVVLSVDDKVENGRIKKVTGNEKLKVLTANLFKQRAYKTMGFSKQQFLQCVQIANSVDLYQLERPSADFGPEDELALIREAIGTN